MTPGQLVKAVAIALDVPEETVVQHDRNLVVAGLRTKGGRGRSAPAVTTLDAARLFTATLGSIRIKDSVATVQAFERTRFDPPKSFAEQVAAFRARGVTVPGDEYDEPDREKFFDMAIMSLPQNHNFVEGLAALISDAGGPLQADQLDKYQRRFAEIIIGCEAPYIGATIGRMGSGGGSVHYRTVFAPLSDAQKQANDKLDSKREKEERYKRYTRIYGIHQRRDVYGTAIMLLGRAFRENGLSFSTTKEALDADWSPRSGASKMHKPAKRANLRKGS
jgi:hypothetical protein